MFRCAINILYINSCLGTQIKIKIYLVNKISQFGVCMIHTVILIGPESLLASCNCRQQQQVNISLQTKRQLIGLIIPNNKRWLQFSSKIIQSALTCRLPLPQRSWKTAGRSVRFQSLSRVCQCIQPPRRPLHTCTIHK